MVNSYFKDLPILDRQSKPRETGINYVRAPVMAGSVVEVISLRSEKWWIYSSSLENKQ